MASDSIRLVPRASFQLVLTVTSIAAMRRGTSARYPAKTMRSATPSARACSTYGAGSPLPTERNHASGTWRNTSAAISTKRS